MRRYFLIMTLLAMGILCSSKANAVPLDVPYGVLITTEVTTTANVPIIFSTTSLPTTNNTNVITGGPITQWCVDNFVFSLGSNPSGQFTMYQSTGSLTAGTTFYSVTVSSYTTPYNSEFAYRTPLCSLRGNQLDMQTNVTGATLSYEVYSYKGWNP